MAITQCMVTSFKEDVFLGVHNFGSDVFKLALYEDTATLDATTTAYTATGEVVAVGYTAGGNTLTGVTISTGGTTAFVDFSDTTWLDVTLTARGALLYNSSKSNKAVAVLDFGGNKTSTASDFTVIMPTPAASTALVRFE